MGTRFCWLGVVIAGLTSGWVRAAAGPAHTNAPVERILQQELRQEQLRHTTHRVGQQLRSIIQEFEENAISGEDLRTLKAIQHVLERLSEKDMRLVISSLEEARTSVDEAASRQRLTGAYTGQKAILTLLKQLVLEYERQQALYELSLRFREMAARQTRNLRAGARLVRENESQRFNNEQRLLIQMQCADQVNIVEETAVLANRLLQIADGAPETSNDRRAKMAAACLRDTRLLDQARAASDLLKAGRLLDAIGEERKVRNTLRDLARHLLISEDRLDLLRAAIAETETTILHQQQVLEETQRLASREDALLAQDHQLEIVDDTNLIRRDVTDVAPAASGLLREAEFCLQDVTAILTNWDRPEKKRGQAVVKQAEALTKLESAKQSLQDQLARAEREGSRPEDDLERLRQLKEEVKDLARSEEALKQETGRPGQKPEERRAAAPRQGDLRDRAQDAQREAAAILPSAARALESAAREMESAQKILAQGRDALPNQEAAVEALRQAERQLDEQITVLESARQQLPHLEELAVKVGNLIQTQQRLGLETTAQVGRPERNLSTLGDLAADQKAVALETSEVRQEAAHSSPSAAPHLEEAVTRMRQAGQSLENRHAEAAQPSQDKALGSLLAAKHTLDQHIEELHRLLGHAPTTETQDLANAARKLLRAQAAVDQAWAQLSPAPSDLLAQLIQSQKRIESDLAGHERSTDQSPPAASQQARQAAAEAVNNLSEGRLAEAVAAMQRVEERISTLSPGPPAPTTNGLSPQANGQPQTTPPSLPTIAARQAEIRQQTETLANAQRDMPENALDRAAEHLTRAALDTAEVASGQTGTLPETARVATESALQSLHQGLRGARARRHPQAQAHTQAAADALSRALAALVLAQAGLGDEMAQTANQPSPLQPSSALAGGQPSQQPGQSSGLQGSQPAAPGLPSMRGTGQIGNWTGSGARSGVLRNATGAGSHLQLPARDRAAIQQSAGESYPQEYGPLVEQYLKNLSDQR